MAIDKTKKRQHPVVIFHYMVDGHNILRRLINEFNLCAKLCFMEKGKDECTGVEKQICFGACMQNEKAADYNKRVTEAFASLKEQPSFAIIDKGINGNDKSCILIEQGKFYGMGYLPDETEIKNLEQIKNNITQYRENNFIRNLVNSYAARFPLKVISFK